MSMRFRPSTHAVAVLPVVLAAVLVGGSAVAADPASPPESPLPGVLARLAGTWSEVLATDDRCEVASRPHRWEFSADGLRLTQRFEGPVYAGDPAPEVRRYRILYGDDDSVMLYREDESFEDAATGDRMIRELVLDAPDRYRWRLYGKPRDWRATMTGRKCARPDAARPDAGG